MARVRRAQAAQEPATLPDEAWNYERVMRYLGVSRTTLYELMSDQASAICSPLSRYGTLSGR
jgi:DNA-binding NtrC family response regulator